MNRMKRNKNITSERPRRTRLQQKPSVFSYYASRSPGEDNLQKARNFTRESPDKKNLEFEKERFLTNAPTIITGLILFVCLVYITSLSPHANIKITRQKDSLLINDIGSYQSGIDETLKNSLAYRSKLLIDTQNLSQNIVDKYPQLGDVSIELPLIGRRPVVLITPPSPVMILSVSGHGYIVDSNGRVLTDVKNVSSHIKDSLPTLQDESDLTFKPAQYAMSRESAQFISDIFQQLSRQNYQISRMTLPVSANELQIKVSHSQCFIKFDLKGDSRLQAGTFIATEKKLKKDNITPKNYIDVRVPGKVFYK